MDGRLYEAMFEMLSSVIEVADRIKKKYNITEEEENLILEQLENLKNEIKG